MIILFNINGQFIFFDVDGDMFLLWVVWDMFDLKGIKFGCGKVACGVCIFYVDGKAICFCFYVVKYVEGKNIIIIEGFFNGDQFYLVQQAWMEEIVFQCGYCQFGFMMVMVVFLLEIFNFMDEDIDNNIVNVCCCVIYYWMCKVIYWVVDI